MPNTSPDRSLASQRVQGGRPSVDTSAPMQPAPQAVVDRPQGPSPEGVGDHPLARLSGPAAATVAAAQSSAARERVQQHGGNAWRPVGLDKPEHAGGEVYATDTEEESAWKRRRAA